MMSISYHRSRFYTSFRCYKLLVTDFFIILFDLPVQFTAVRVGGLLHHFRKEVMALPLSLTFHVGKYTVTITIRNTHRRTRSEDRNEKSDRHSAK